MTAKFSRDGLNLTRHLLDYVRRCSVVESDAQRAIREETAGLEMARMMISPEQAQVMAFLARLVRAARIVEVGTFTGYSASWFAEAVEPGGKVVACDKNAEYMAIARRHWERAGLSDRIESRLGPGADSLRDLLSEGWAGTVDLIFIDADKTGCQTYYELGLQLLRPGGILLFDNVLWGGSVADPSDTTDDTEALRQIAATAAGDPSVASALMTIGDGLLAVLKPHAP